jgi:hypothetical protein
MMHKAKQYLKHDSHMILHELDSKELSYRYSWLYFTTYVRTVFFPLLILLLIVYFSTSLLTGLGISVWLLISFIAWFGFLLPQIYFRSKLYFHKDGILLFRLIFPFVWKFRVYEYHTLSPMFWNSVDMELHFRGKTRVPSLLLTTEDYYEVKRLLQHKGVRMYER